MINLTSRSFSQAQTHSNGFKISLGGQSFRFSRKRKSFERKWGKMARKPFFIFYNITLIIYRQMSLSFIIVDLHLLIDSRNLLIDCALALFLFFLVLPSIDRFQDLLIVSRHPCCIKFSSSHLSIDKAMYRQMFIQLIFPSFLSLYLSIDVEHVLIKSCPVSTFSLVLSLQLIPISTYFISINQNTSNLYINTHT